MNKVLAAALIAAGFAVSGCGSNYKEAQGTNPHPCPNVIVLNEASRQIEFDGDAALDNITYSAEILNATVSCRYFADEPIEAEVKIDFGFGRGPKGENGDHPFRYFVAVTRKDLEVIAKEEFWAVAKFSETRDIVHVTDEVDKIVIPRANEETSGLNFEIIVGISVTPQQAIYNRSGTSLKFPEL